MQLTITTRTAAIGAILTALALFDPARAVEPIDRIAAVVNEDIVLASEVLERYEGVTARLVAEGQELPSRDAIMEQILERLIIENIQLQEAERRGIQVDDETLTAAVSEVAAQNGLDLDQFIETLGAEGVSYRDFRDQVRRQITMERLQREVVNRRVYITAQDVDELLASPFFAEHISDEYRIGHILLLTEAGASRAQVNAVKGEAEALIEKLRAGADFGALAVEHSAGSKALEGGDLGWRKASRIPSLFADTVQNMAVGDVAGPLQNASGLHIVKLIDKRGASQQTTREALVRHILLMPSAIRDEAETKALMEELAAELRDGGDFAALAREHSDDPGSALAGGELGWRTAQDFVPEFQAAMQAAAIGKLTAPFRSAYGWHVLEVRDRREQDASEEAQRDLATRVLHAQRFDERLQEWLREIRDEAFVEMRLDTGGGETDDDDTAG